MSKKLIKSEISQHVLMIGVYYKHNAAGGMASVIQYYEKYFEKLQYISSWRDKHFAIKIYYALKAYLNILFKLSFNKKIKIVHIHTAADRSFKRKSIFVFLAKYFNKKIILHIHGSRFKDFYNESENKFKIIDNLQKADKIVVLSHSWKEWFISIGLNSEKIIILNNIVDYPKTQKKDYENKIKLLFLGEIGKRKGVFDIIEVLDHNSDLYKNEIIFKIGGNKETEKLIQKIDEYQLSDFVKFEGWVSGDKKINLLNWADIFILPSFNEGLPIAILEAMSYGKAIISSPVGGIAEIVQAGKNGILVEPGNQKEISEAINFFINNKSIIGAFGDHSKEIIEPFYPKSVLSSLLALYNNLLMK
jgi:glycosyltransferase involved in cell wall biosynthesis